ncbi:hypothetical protein PPL_08301 [Heterostelium album PN500]|uniref:B box-type domain-containing protein n=1 Tax=Heterostelium pallidum (strain ATCC 26659 / Pp 5 / PN500) TaxID=670386 RepID=D3BHT7_HETP5|nr:hypothetical protein PPL_08301 [Heterostelium album PN500]EFA78837.1 hypothetical protein PPL_08301 [Heterostelium album PN500]|eukprot:XP_020430961.1 hypothetical protein PPL_08301 [Heterostelium album PN500]
MDIREKRCNEHNKTHKYICLLCMKFMCPICIFAHGAEQPTHTNNVQPIESVAPEIKQSIYDLDNQASGIPKVESDYNSYSSFIQSKRESTWKAIKSSTTKFKELLDRENRMLQNFKELQEYLATEENKFKQLIDKDREMIEKHINESLNELKELNITTNMMGRIFKSQMIGNSTLFNSTPTATLLEQIASSSEMNSFINEKENDQILLNNDIKEVLQENNLSSSSSSSQTLSDIVSKYNDQFYSHIRNNNNNTKNDNNIINSEPPMQSYNFTIKLPSPNPIELPISKSKSSQSIFTFKCSKHDEPFDFICHLCNKLMCSFCKSNHIINKPGHSDHCEHIDEIKASLYYLFNNPIFIERLDKSVLSISPTTTVSQSISSLWETLKSSTSEYQSLIAAENEIKQHFELLHQRLVIEEHRLKKIIIADQDTIINQIDKNINHLKFIVNIINIYNNLLNNKKDNNIYKFKNKNIDSIYNSNDKYSNESILLVGDTTEQYSPTTIMKSISSCSSLKSFIDENIQTLFYQDKYNNYYNPYDHLNLLEQSNSDSILLDYIQRFYTHIKSSQYIDYYKSYNLLLKEPDFNQWRSMIKQSIKLEKIGSPIEPSLSSYIFTTHQSKGATLINLSNKNTIEQLELDYDFNNTDSSIVSIGEYIYVFGGLSNPICYDGQDHIYFVNGAKTNNRIDRFNIKTMQFARYLEFSENDIYSQDTLEKTLQRKQLHGPHAASMIFNGSLYSVPHNSSMIIQFDLTSRKITRHKIHISTYSACHDNNGNFFIHDRVNKRFIKYNVKKKQTFTLNTIPAKDSHINSSSSIGNTPSLHGGSGVLFILKDSEIIILNQQQPQQQQQQQQQQYYKGTESFLKNVKAPVVRAVAEGLKINKVGSKELIIDKILETIFNFRQLNSAEKEDSDGGSPLELPIILLSPHSTPETMIEEQEEESTPSPPLPTTASAYSHILKNTQMDFIFICLFADEMGWRWKVPEPEDSVSSTLVFDKRYIGEDTVVRCVVEFGWW